MTVRTRNIAVWCQLILMYCVLTTVSFSQTVQATIDKSKILIGEQIHCTVKASFNKDAYRIFWFTLPDSIPHFEVVQAEKIDSVFKNGNSTLTQTITYTSFDSGKWVLPSLVIEAKDIHSDSVITLKTDSFAVDVTYAPADSTAQLRDIKPIMGVTITDYFIYYIIGGALLLVLLAWLLWRYYIRKKEKPATHFNAGLTPYEQAMHALEKLKTNTLNSEAAIKHYHVSLAEIFKKYYSRKMSVNIMSSTTDDVLIELSRKNIVKEDLSEAAKALRCGDAVKFAKYMPSISETENCREIIAGLINKLELVFNKQ